MNVKTNNYYGTYMRVLQEMQKTSGYYGNYMRVLQGMLKKNPTTTKGPICGYCNE